MTATERDQLRKHITQHMGDGTILLMPPETLLELLQQLDEQDMEIEKLLDSIRRKP